MKMSIQVYWMDMPQLPSDISIRQFKDISSKSFLPKLHINVTMYNSIKNNFKF